MKHLVFAALAALSLGALAADAVPAKYVFLFIGDGMSFPQRMMADEFYLLTEQRHLTINSFPCQSPTVTRSANSFITDSAASGTAIACGAKTVNGRIGMDPDGNRLESVAEVARKAGRKVGIITSVTLNHATPAAFYGHQHTRGESYRLGLDAIASGFDYFGGGGFDAPDDQKNSEYRGELYGLFAEAGYKVARSRAEFAGIRPGDGKVLSVGAPGALPYAIDRREGDLKLSEFVEQGIRMLEDSPTGFFMMTEGGKIDWMCHANDAATVMREVIDFDEAVQVAYRFYEAHPDETLIVVTGDHETGGLTLGFAGTGYNSYFERLANQKCSREGFVAHVWDLINGKKTEAGFQTISFEDVKPVITADFGLKFIDDVKDPMRLHTAERQKLREAFERDFPDGKATRFSKSRNCDVAADAANLATAAVLILDNRAGLGWTSGAHTALPVNTTAIGANSGLFMRPMDNTDISKTLKEIVAR